MRRFAGVASVLFACAGCGKVHDLTDASNGIDAKSVDANTTADATTDVVVTTYSRQASGHKNGTLEAGISVISVQPNGSLGPTGTTDANGQAILTGVQAGATVTAIYPSTGSFKIVTMAGVKPGDHLTFGERYTDDPGTGGTGTLTINFTPPPNAVNYDVYWKCGSQSVQSAPTSFSIAETCGATTVTVFVIASDANFQVVATGVLKDAPFNGDQTATLTNWTVSPELQLAAEVTGVGADVTNADLGAGTIVDDAYQFSRWNFVQLASGTGSYTVPLLPGSDRIDVFSELHGPQGFGRQEMYKAVAPDATTGTLTAPAMPWLGAPSTFDAASQKVSWTTMGTGTYDTAVVELNWTKGNDIYDWTISIAPGASEVTWSPPTELAQYLPGTTDTINGTVMLVDLSTATSHDELRAAPEWQWSCPACATRTGELTGQSNVSFDGAEGNPGF